MKKVSLLISRNPVCKNKCSKNQLFLKKIFVIKSVKIKFKVFRVIFVIWIFNFLTSESCMLKLTTKSLKEKIPYSKVLKLN
jgi:hypothetical protein